MTDIRSLEQTLLDNCKSSYLSLNSRLKFLSASQISALISRSII
jgi:hypothetical protein